MCTTVLYLCKIIKKFLDKKMALDCIFCSALTILWSLWHHAPPRMISPRLGRPQRYTVLPLDYLLSLWLEYLLRPEPRGHAEDIGGEVGGPAHGGAGPEDGHVCGGGAGGVGLPQEAGQEAGPVDNQAGQRHCCVLRGHLHVIKKWNEYWKRRKAFIYNLMPKITGDCTSEEGIRDFYITSERVVFL
jgi:hypothetical protein